MTWIGFPKVHSAIISDYGIIEDFWPFPSIHSQYFPRLPKKMFRREQGYHQIEIAYPIFGFYDNGSMYYLSTNPDSLVSRQILGYNINQVRTILNSKIPNLHEGLAAVIGILANGYFWVLGGDIVKNNTIGKFDFLSNTSQ